MNDSRKTFWIIASIIALAGVAAAVAYFVAKYVRSRNEETFEDLYDCDCDGFFDDCDCGCGPDCDCGCQDGEPCTCDCE